MSPHERPLGDSTRCVHSGRRATADDPGLVTPVVRSSTFLQHPEAHAATDAGRWDDAWVYARYGTPTVVQVERKLAELEGAEGCALFASGVAALHAAIVAAAGPGSTIAVSSQIYGGTRAILFDELTPLGHRTVEFDLSDPSSLRALAGEGITAVVVESLSNPTVIVADLPRLAEEAHALGARLVVDATFATPLLQRPLALGADLVVHSASKALGGHSDLIAGLVCGAGELLARARLVRKHLGAVLDPAPAALLERGLKTLALRVRAQVAAAGALARALREQERVEAVHYPGLPDDPGHELARELLAAPGSVLSFVHAEGDDALRPLVSRLRLALDAPSLGGVETLVSLPAFMSHAGLSAEERERAGVVPGLVRVACGIEDPEDLIADFAQALNG